jgi:hypothetical protein
MINPLPINEPNALCAADLVKFSRFGMCLTGIGFTNIQHALYVFLRLLVQKLLATIMRKRQKMTNRVTANFALCVCRHVGSLKSRQQNTIKMLNQEICHVVMQFIDQVSDIIAHSRCGHSHSLLTLLILFLRESRNQIALAKMTNNIISIKGCKGSNAGINRNNTGLVLARENVRFLRQRQRPFARFPDQAGVHFSTPVKTR